MSNKLPKNNRDAQRKCVFCNGLPLSKEHIFPNWIKNVLFIDPAIKNHSTKRTYTENDEFKNITILKSGHIFSKKHLIACVKCNGGWMSILQSQTKPILTNLMLSLLITLKKKDIIQLSKWIVMSTMVSEFDDLRTKTIPIQQLKEFKKNKEIPVGWKIWIGNYEGRQYGFQHAAIKTIRGSSIGFIQSTMFMLGELIIYVITSNDYNLSNDYENHYTEKLTQIYPLKKRYVFSKIANIEYPFKNTIVEEDIIALKNIKYLSKTTNIINVQRYSNK